MGELGGREHMTEMRVVKGSWTGWGFERYLKDQHFIHTAS